MRRLILIVIVFVLPGYGCDGGDTAHSKGGTPSEAADIIFYNGEIVTVDKDFSLATALGISGDRIIAVGTNEEVLSLAGTETQTIDLDGRSVIPGLIDSHIHALGYGLHTTQHVMFSTGERLSVASMLDRIRARAEQIEGGEWIYVRGPWSLDFIDEGRLPNRDELDTVTPDNPVFINTQGHIGVVNSKALEIAGVSEDTPDPPNGVYMRDEETGRLTGEMFEFPTFTPFVRHIPPHTFEARVEAVRQANRDFTRLGITSVVNLWAEPENVEVLRFVQDAGDMTVRWSMVYRLSASDFVGKSPSEIRSRMRELAATAAQNDEWVSVDGIKIIYDGFAEAAYMHDPYLEGRFGSGWKGVAFWDSETLREVMQAGLENDLQVYVHVAGDKALDDVLDAMSSLNDVTPLAGKRWTLEHASTVPTPDNIRQARNMRLVVSTQQAMGWSIGKTFKAYWGEDRGAAFAPNRSWLEALGHPYVKAGSDNRPIDPFIGIWAYLTREDVDGEVGKPGERLNLPDTLRLYTANGAFGIFREDSIGSLEVGKLADLVVLPVDLLEMPEDDIRNVKPDMTVVGGKIRYQR